MVAELLFFPFMIVFMLIGIAIAILVTAFWIWMIVDVAKRNFTTSGQKVGWILVVVLVQILGAVIYFYVHGKDKLK